MNRSIQNVERGNSKLIEQAARRIINRNDLTTEQKKLALVVLAASSYRYEGIEIEATLGCVTASERVAIIEQAKMVANYCSAQKFPTMTKAEFEVAVLQNVSRILFGADSVTQQQREVFGAFAQDDQFDRFINELATTETTVDGESYTLSDMAASFGFSASADGHTLKNVLLTASRIPTTTQQLREVATYREGGLPEGSQAAWQLASMWQAANEQRTAHQAPNGVRPTDRDGAAQAQSLA